MFVFDAFQIPKDQMQYSELVTGTESLLLQSLLVKMNLNHHSGFLRLFISNLALLL